MTTSVDTIPGWDQLRHGGLLFDGARLATLSKHAPTIPLSESVEQRLRQRANSIADDSTNIPAFVAFVLERVCGLDDETGTWLRGNSIGASWRRRAITGENVKPRQLWQGEHGATLPVFIDDNKRIGIGRGLRTISQVLGWLRAGNEHIALITNGRQWRLLFAGLDYDAWCEWDLDLWFEEGELSSQVTALRMLVSTKLLTPESEETEFPLLQAIRDTRKGQADLSEALGERVREAVEILIQGHGDALNKHCSSVPPADIYRAACRTAMRLVVILFAESRDLLPRDNALYHGSYGLNGLFEYLEREAARGVTLANNSSAWPRVLALFNLVLQGSHHPELPITAYGGELFAKGSQGAKDGVSRSLYVFENSCFESEGAQITDHHVHEMLKLLTRTKIRIRSGRGTTSTVLPVDFSDLSSEYIGILYEGLLDYELKTAPQGETVVFLSRGDRPALPLSRLESMGDAALRELFKSFKQGSSHQEDDDLQEDEKLAETKAPETQPNDLSSKNGDELSGDTRESIDAYDTRHQYQTRAQEWALRVVEVMKLAKKQGDDTPEGRLKLKTKTAAEARRLVARVVLPGEQYLVRWGGTRKGSGSFYTRPGLAVPTVQRTLRPLAYDPPEDGDGNPDRSAHASRWTPKLPEQILDIKVCDPACGSGTFPLAALRFLTDALYASLQYHQRIEPDGERSLVRLLGIRNDGASEDTGQSRLTEERIPCPPDADDFEPRLKALLRRYVVERCIYAVDLDPLAVELCRLSLWIETMNRNLPFGFLDHKVKCGNALIGAWYDQFLHYPVMAWKNRDGGDRGHTNGVYFERNTRTDTIKEFVKERLRPDLELFLRQDDLFQNGQLEAAFSTHDDALAVLADIHDMRVRNADDADEQARIYREEFLGSPAWLYVKALMDLWCACWFWPVDKIDLAPLPGNFDEPPDETRAVVEQIADDMRFFHWELEFPDVFQGYKPGFHAILGNPPWDVPKPVSKEFFSNIDPLYRTYGKQEALEYQTEYFKDQENNTELHWLNYIAGFRAQSNFVGYVRNPFGDLPKNVNGPGRFTISRGKQNKILHDRWRHVRSRSTGYSDPAHPFRHQGSADLNLYKMFLEAAHALLRHEGRLGFIVPSGLYSDDGTKSLRTLFFDHCRWEWLFGIENRSSIFPIDTRSKFNPVVIEKGGTTGVIQTAFMRRNLADWEHAEEFSIPYSKKLADRFSPSNHTFVEIQSKRDLEILEKIYANGRLLGDEGPKGWGIRYSREFDMTNDSHLFPPRAQWEEEGYRPDEYSRWLQGDWRPAWELWESLGIYPTRAEPEEVELEGWLFDAAASPERREAEAQYVHGHLLKPGDVVRTDYSLRCAQPPYDRLPIPRSKIPSGVIFSREGDAWIREDDIEDAALPLYQGKMMYVGKWTTSTTQFSDSGRVDLAPEFLLAMEDIRHDQHSINRTMLRDISRSTDERSFIAALTPSLFPSGHTTPILKHSLGETTNYLDLIGALISIVFDWSVRQRMSGTHLSWHMIETLALPSIHSSILELDRHLARLFLGHISFAGHWLQFSLPSSHLHPYACSSQERLRIIAMLNATVAATMGLSASDFRHILKECDHPRGSIKGDHPKGFWRIDKNKNPELRETVLSLIAFYDLEKEIKAASGDVSKGISTFLDQNRGEGWMLPETLCLADYDLGHDVRARHPQPVASCLGPRFYDWQLLQSREESWQECHLHARNQHGVYGYARHIFELTRQQFANDKENFDLPTDPLIRNLLGKEGIVSFLQILRAREYLSKNNFSKVLDRLRTQGLLGEDDYRKLLTRDLAAMHDETLLQVAEPHAGYQVGPDDKQSDLFKKS